MAESCVTFDCVEIPNECTTTTSTVTVVNNNTGNCIDTSGVITIMSDCECCVSVTPLSVPNGIAVNNEGGELSFKGCTMKGHVYVVQLDGCNCECLCGPAGIRHKAGHAPPSCVVQSDPDWGGVTTLTIGPLKSTRKFEIELDCDEIKCPECC